MLKATYDEIDIIPFGTTWTVILSYKTIKINGYNMDCQSCMKLNIIEMILHNQKSTTWMEKCPLILMATTWTVKVV